MTDLRKITTPFGLLDEETKKALMYHGGPYEFWDGNDFGEWSWIEEPSWVCSYVYRTGPGTKPSINWDHVADDYICLVKCFYGSGKLFKVEPRLDLLNPVAPCWWHDTYYKACCADASTFASFREGSCDWKESLVFRPGHEPKDSSNEQGKGKQSDD